MKITRSDYSPQKGDILFVSCEWQGSIGIMVYTWDCVREWGNGLIMRSSETEQYTKYHYLLHHHEFEPGRFYWIWRDTGEERLKERSYWSCYQLTGEMKKSYDV